MFTRDAESKSKLCFFEHNAGGRFMSSLGCLCDPSVKEELAEFVGM